ncbi:Protein MALE DISCOVERER 2 [Bienertia sinuspersici]
MRNNFWVFNGMKMKLKLPFISILLLLLIHLQFLVPCSSLNSEGMALLRFKESVVRDPFNALSNWINENGDLDHCSWFGVFCSDGIVVSLDLKDLCLGGTLAPELGKLSHIKSIILRNNSFDGIIPNEIAELEVLEILDLGYNNFSGSLPSNLGNNFSLSILLLDNNQYLGGLSPELNQLQMLSEHQVDEKQLRGGSAEASCNSKSLSWYASQPNKNSGGRSLLQMPGLSASIRQFNRRGSASAPAPSIAYSPVEAPSPSPSPSDPYSRVSSPSPFSSPSPSPLPSSSVSTAPPVAVVDNPSPPPSNPPVVSESPAQAAQLPHASSTSTAKHNKVIIWASVAGGSAFIIISAVAIIICRSSKMGAVKPWATGLSGQLQRAFVSGVPKLKRTELETACEDFSNIIGSLNDGTVYKGTLSSGIEIAVVATTVKSAEGWSRKLEAQFRKKVETLSKVNHKNFVNLIGYCVEEKPFTRMMYKKLNA